MFSLSFDLIKSKVIIGLVSSADLNSDCGRLKNTAKAEVRSETRSQIPKPALVFAKAGFFMKEIQL